METFEIKEHHIKLLKEMNIDWNDCEFGAPSVDPKRPYGNSDVMKDIIEIVENDNKKTIICPHCEEEINSNALEKGDSYYITLHQEMQKVLQIICCTASVKIGKYVKNKEYSYSSWELVEE